MTQHRSLTATQGKKPTAAIQCQLPGWWGWGHFHPQNCRRAPAREPSLGLDFGVPTPSICNCGQVMSPLLMGILNQKTQGQAWGGSEGRM